MSSQSEHEQQDSGFLSETISGMQSTSDSSAFSALSRKDDGHVSGKRHQPNAGNGCNARHDPDNAPCHHNVKQRAQTTNGYATLVDRSCRSTSFHASGRPLAWTLLAAKSLRDAFVICPSGPANSFPGPSFLQRRCRQLRPP
ncbi:hypothetical protein BIW11_12954 [Tropilaelaps mercedesae]|uniref:Uncharacterized protein n=1 Tax=Tropilaelaps mercedesae TaxID=418985 RepID=A0A1V9X4S0_9ACAR|nr:hypothetical protein BIW11_12954 [Tropilaelaps mercedesae]